MALSPTDPKLLERFRNIYGLAQPSSPDSELDLAQAHPKVDAAEGDRSRPLRTGGSGTHRDRAFR
jgi:hypothetical protein